MGTLGKFLAIVAGLAQVVRVAVEHLVVQADVAVFKRTPFLLLADILLPNHRQRGSRRGQQSVQPDALDGEVEDIIAGIQAVGEVQGSPVAGIEPHDDGIALLDRREVEVACVHHAVGGGNEREVHLRFLAVEQDERLFVEAAVFLQADVSHAASLRAEFYLNQIVFQGYQFLRTGHRLGECTESILQTCLAHGVGQGCQLVGWRRLDTLLQFLFNLLLNQGDGIVVTPLSLDLLRRRTVPPAETEEDNADKNKSDNCVLIHYLSVVG